MPIITVRSEILRLVPLMNGDLEAVSLEMVRMFHRDAEAAGFKL